MPSGTVRIHLHPLLEFSLDQCDNYVTWTGQTHNTPETSFNEEEMNDSDRYSHGQLAALEPEF